jgi:ribosomal protein L7/L12
MITLAEAYEALNGHDEFVVKEYEDRVSFDYVVIFPGSFDATDDEIRYRAYLLWEKAGGPLTDSDQFWHQAKIDIEKFASIRRNFRGVTFDANTGEIISLPLQKFFNVNQVAETQYDLIKDQKAIIYEKLDGTMIHFFLHNGKLEASTCRSSQNIYSKEALALAKQNDLEDVIIDVINSGYTPVFEYVAPTNQIVIQYKNSRLVYLISRERNTGKYHFHDIFSDKANRFEFQFSEIFNNLDKTDFEGYVCHLPSMIVKAKTPWYVDRHRAVDALMRPAYKLYQIVFDGTMDDLIAIAAESYKPSLRKIYEEAQRDLLKERLRLEAIFEDLQKEISQIEESKEENPLEDFEKEIKEMVSSGERIEAIKLVRNKMGIGLNNSKRFVEEGVWPHGLIQRNEQELEAKRISRKTNQFVDIVRKNHFEDFQAIMAFYNGCDPSTMIKEKLMNVYREIYIHKLYAEFDDSHENG